MCLKKNEEKEEHASIRKYIVRIRTVGADEETTLPFGTHVIYCESVVQIYNDKEYIQNEWTNNNYENLLVGQCSVGRRRSVRVQKIGSAGEYL